MKENNSKITIIWSILVILLIGTVVLVNVNGTFSQTINGDTDGDGIRDDFDGDGKDDTLGGDPVDTPTGNPNWQPETPSGGGGGNTQPGCNSGDLDCDGVIDDTEKEIAAGGGTEEDKESYCKDSNDPVCTGINGSGGNSGGSTANRKVTHNSDGTYSVTYINEGKIVTYYYTSDGKIAFIGTKEDGGKEVLTETPNASQYCEKNGACTKTCDNGYEYRNGDSGNGCYGNPKVEEKVVDEKDCNLSTGYAICEILETTEGYTCKFDGETTHCKKTETNYSCEGSAFYDDDSGYCYTSNVNTIINSTPNEDGSYTRTEGNIEYNYDENGKLISKITRDSKGNIIKIEAKAGSAWSEENENGTESYDTTISCGYGTTIHTDPINGGYSCYSSEETEKKETYSCYGDNDINKLSECVKNKEAEGYKCTWDVAGTRSYCEKTTVKYKCNGKENDSYYDCRVSSATVTVDKDSSKPNDGGDGTGSGSGSGSGTGSGGTGGDNTDNGTNDGTGSNNENVTTNPQTGTIEIAIAWFAGIFAIACAFMYFRKVEFY